MFPSAVPVETPRVRKALGKTGARCECPTCKIPVNIERTDDSIPMTWKVQDNWDMSTGRAGPLYGSSRTITRRTGRVIA